MLYAQALTPTIESEYLAPKLCSLDDPNMQTVLKTALGLEVLNFHLAQELAVSTLTGY